MRHATPRLSVRARPVFVGGLWAPSADSVGGIHRIGAHGDRRARDDSDETGTTARASGAALAGLFVPARDQRHTGGRVGRRRRGIATMTSFRTLTVGFGGQVLMTSTLSKFPYAIGELPNNDLPLPQISPAHAQIELISGRVFLTDLGSQQGTLVAGVPLQPHQPLMLVDGVSIRIGPYDIVYRSAIDQAEESAVALEPHVLEESPQVLDADDVVVDPAFRRLRTPATANGNFAIGVSGSYLPVMFQDSEGETLTVSLGDRVLATSPLEKSPYRIGGLPLNDLCLSQISPSHAERTHMR